MSASGKRYRILGLVQGVGFRAYTCRAGSGLGLSGWVMNLDDGTVVAFASGPEGAHLAFESALRRGPHGGRVDRVDVEPAPSEEDAPSRSHRFG
ncbi:MAG: acylphosphatase [Gemmatimonadales bacterium]